MVKLIFPLPSPPGENTPEVNVAPGVPVLIMTALVVAPVVMVPPPFINDRAVFPIRMAFAVVLVRFKVPFVLLLNVALFVPVVPVILPEPMLIVPVLVSVVLLSPRIMALVRAVPEPTVIVPLLLKLPPALAENALITAPSVVGLKLMVPELVIVQVAC